MKGTQAKKVFSFGHLPEGPIRDMSERFYKLAMQLSSELPDTPSRAAALRRLWDAKNWAVLSTVHRGGQK